MNSIRKHMEEYSNSVKVIENKIPKNKLPGNPLDGIHPVSIAEILLKNLKECQSAEDYNTSLNSSTGSMKARNAHDFFGWMAKQGKNQQYKLGACKGTIYRSDNYMNIPLDKRNGSKPKDTPNHVHIEHTIPVNVILRYIWNIYNKDIGRFSDLLMKKKLYEDFISVSVCTALTEDEEKTIGISKALKKEHPDFEGRKIRTDLMAVRPFKRYDFSKGLKIYEMITGSEINPETFTLKDHVNLINNVDIYDWDYISSMYPL